MSTLIEVSNTNADVATTTTLTTVISPPIAITSPSVLSFAEGFIDQRDIGNSGTDAFIVDSPISASFEMAYYEVFNDQPASPNQRNSAFDNTTAIDLTKVKGGVFALYKVLYTPGRNTTYPQVNFAADSGRGGGIEELELVTETFNFIIQPGTYTATTIVQTINDQMQGTFYPGDGFYKSDNLGLGTEDNAFYYPFKHFVDKYVDYDGTTKIYRRALVFLRVDDNPLKTDFTKDLGQYYYNQEPDTVVDAFIGCPICALQNTDDIMSFAYLHNPVYKLDANGDRNEYIQLNENVLPGTEGINFYWVYARGGVALTQLEPTKFWDDLMGFNTQTFLLRPNRVPLVTPGSPANAVIDLINITGNNSLSGATTRPFIGVSDVDEYVIAGVVNTFLTDTIFNTNPPKPIRILDVNNTVAIKAAAPIQFSQLNTGGHYRIEVDIGYYVNNFNSSKTKRSIACIASREYLTNGFLSVFSGAQPITIPTGAVLSYISVSIIDPLTGKAPTDIGNSNTFYFSLTS